MLQSLLAPKAFILHRPLSATMRSSHILVFMLHSKQKDGLASLSNDCKHTLLGLDVFNILERFYVGNKTRKVCLLDSLSDNFGHRPFVVAV